jgi:hypothetical protein
VATVRINQETTNTILQLFRYDRFLFWKRLAEMGAPQERITSTKKGSITSFQAVYVPDG